MVQNPNDVLDIAPFLLAEELWLDYPKGTAGTSPLATVAKQLWSWPSVWDLPRPAVLSSDDRDVLSPTLAVRLRPE